MKHIMTAMSGQFVPGGVLDGKYILRSTIGGGRFGTVYRALHIALQKPVAVKVLHAGDDLAARDFEQFRVEAEALGRLSHPNIVGVTDFGVDPRGTGTPYLVMELVEGTTLEEIAARDGPIDLERVAPWIRQVAAALDHAHTSGVAHGDLSARNVVLVGAGEDVTAKVIDFGLARLVHMESAHLAPGDAQGGPADFRLRFAGTPEYTAPERLRGEPPSTASDVYALAVLAYRLITGRHPFEGDTRTVLHAQLTAQAQAPSALVAGLPAAVDTALARGLAKPAGARPSTAGELAGHLTVAARQLAHSRWRLREAPRRLALAAGLSLLLAALGPWLASLDVVARLEGAAMDARFALTRPRAPDPRLLLVSLDDDSLDVDATPLAARGDEFAGALDAAFDNGAAVVALDLLLPEAWASAQRFGGMVLARADRLVLGMASDDLSVVGPEAIDALVVGALGPEATSRLFGLVTHVPAPDGVVRRARTAVVDREGKSRSTLAGRVIEIARVGPAPMRTEDGDRDFLVDYRVEASRFDRMGWRQFSQAAASGARFDDRILLVGAEFTGSGDRHRIPGPGRLSAEVSGLALQGVITDTLLRGRALRDVPARWTWPLAGAALFGTALSILWARRPLKAGAAVLAVLFVVVLGALLAFRAGRVMPMAAPGLLWLAVAGAALAVRSRLPAPPQ